MGSFWIAFLAGIGSSGWVYSKTQRKTGGNTKSSVITAGVCGIAVFIVLWILLELFI
ncbi:MAG TPA: hypothetical protein VJJ78_02790 [Candidatus Saccharimonadales bacterium]|nr:hypothetical protein [Candidatus Saccharimonadales bacterium]